MADRTAESFARRPQQADGESQSGSLAAILDAENHANNAAASVSPAVDASASVSPPATTETLLAALARTTNTGSNANGGGGTVASAPPKLRSCVVCRTRKVRCNKESPCSNCRRAGIPCVIPSAERPPRWARRLERVAHNAVAEERLAQASRSPTAQVMERLRNLEGLVKDLSSQLELAQAAANSSAGNSPASSANDRDADHQRAATPSTAASSIQSRFGRLVLDDASRSRYVSSGFWSRVNDELRELRTETQYLAEADLDSSEDEEPSGLAPPTQELARTASERHAFLFQHNLNPSGPDPRQLHPLPSQIPFLLDVFQENVNIIVQIVHMPTIKAIARRSRSSDSAQMTPANEALMFSIYYAAVTSMEDSDVMKNFGSTKTDLNLKYRLGLEHALARADFLNVPDVVLVQAFAIFLLLVRRHDSPRFVWMMTGLVIRMAHALGLQRDGSNFKNLTPYEVDVRRRVWYALCSLDVRASEDQGTDFTIHNGSFDTKLPRNINDNDIDIDTKETPPEREGLTDMTIALVSMEISHISRQMLTPGTSFEEQNRLLDTINVKLEERYLRFSPEPGNVAYWIMVVTTRLVIGKLTLFTHLPVLFSSPSDHFSDEVRNRLLVAAIEVAELNHALNAEKACRQWRWVFQTYTHWYAIVYLLIDICRRPWSSIVERAWVALQSPWLIPAKSKLDKNLRTWVPLRKLMLKARKHRDAELERLRGDALSARQLEIYDKELPMPATAGSVPADTVANSFRENWRKLIGISVAPGNQLQMQNPPPYDSLGSTGSTQRTPYSNSLNLNDMAKAGTNAHHMYPPMDTVTMNASMQEASVPPTARNNTAFEEPFQAGLQMNAFSEATINWPNPHMENDRLMEWFGADADPAVDSFADIDNMGAMDFNFDSSEEVDWYNWVESARGLEMGAHTSTNNPTG
ncbi:hypothetical protein F4777DRAFT_597616 [Nemania sp. FL0916]|nr:hypothetical protein F4777DRAFT_597616 [Nemania sp. FL0916]